MARQPINTGTEQSPTTWGVEAPKIESNFVELYPLATGAIPATQKGAANGVATLNGSGLIPSSQLPSYVDDVLEFANLAAFPATGETGKLYVAIDTNLVYRWSGSTYTRVDQTDLTDYYTKTQAYALLTGKQNTLTFDNTPTNGSINPVTSDGVYDAIASVIENGGAITKSGGIITFDVPAVYNADTPYTGAISLDFTGAVVNTQVYFRSNATAQQLPSSYKGGNGWAAGQDNWMLITYLGGTNVIYQNASSVSAGVNPVTTIYATQDTPNAATSGIAVVGMDTISFLAGRYLVEGFLWVMCSGSGGVGFAAPIPAAGRGVNSKIGIFAGRTGAATAFAQSNPFSPATTLTTTKYATASTTVAQAAVLPIAGYLYFPVDTTFSLIFGSTTTGETSTVMEGSYLTFRKVA